MIITDLRPMSSAPLDGTPVRLFVSAGFAIASFWGVERCQEAFGDGDYRGGWFLLDDDAVDEMRERRMQTKHQQVDAGSRLKLADVREGTALHASLPAVSGKTRRTE